MGSACFAPYPFLVMVHYIQDPKIEHNSAMVLKKLLLTGWALLLFVLFCFNAPLKHFLFRMEIWQDFDSV